MDKLKVDLLRELECPVCFELMKPPISLCVNGHSFCETCKSRLSECSICRGEILEVRNRTAESLARNVKYPCSFQSAGCREEVLLEAKSKHEEVCLYGPYNCPFQIVGKCFWAGPLVHISKHIKNIHTQSIHEVSSGMQSCRIPDYLEGGGWHQSVFTMGEVFFRYSKLVQENLFICCMIMGTSEKAKKYKYEVTIKSVDGVEKESVTRYCPTYKQFVQATFTNENSAQFCFTFTKKCVNKEGQLPYDFELSKV